MLRQLRRTARELRLALRMPKDAGWGRLAPSELATLQERRLRALLRHAVEHSPFYRRHYRGVDVARAPLSELPPVNKETLMGAWDEVVTRPLRRQDVEELLATRPPDATLPGGVHAVHSSGSSGGPAVVVLDREDARWRLLGMTRTARMQRDFRLRRQAVIVPLSSTTSASSRRHGSEPFLARLRHRDFDILGSLDALIDGLNAYQPDAITSYATRLEGLAAEQLAGRLHVRPRVLFSRAENLTAEARELIAGAWRAPVYDAYGAIEVGPIAAQCTRGPGMHLFEDLVVVEPVDLHYRPTPPGEMSDTALVTGLTSRTFPFIRYDLKDAVRLSDGACPCGRTTRRIVELAGRQYPALPFRRPDGSWRLVPPQVVGVPVSTWPGVNRYQIWLKPEGLTVLVVPAPGTRIPTEQLAAAVVSVLERQGVELPPVTVREVEESELRRPFTGKVPRYLCRVQPPDGTL